MRTQGERGSKTGKILQTSFMDVPKLHDYIKYVINKNFEINFSVLLKV